MSFSLEELKTLAVNASREIAYDPITQLTVGICIASKGTDGTIYYTSAGTLGNVATPSAKPPAVVAMSEIISAGKGEPFAVAYCFPQSMTLSGRETTITSDMCEISGSDLQALASCAEGNLPIHILQDNGLEAAIIKETTLEALFPREEYATFGRRTWATSYHEHARVLSIGGDEIHSKATQKILHQRTLDAIPTACAPSSGFHVACTIVYELNSLRHKNVFAITRANVELAREELNLVSCAESSALGAVMMHAKRRPTDITLHAIYVMIKENACGPCGNDRQILREFNSRNAIVYICDYEAIRKQVKFKNLLPHSFGPGHTGRYDRAPEPKNASVLDRPYVKPALKGLAVVAGAFAAYALGKRAFGTSAGRGLHR